MTLQTHFVHSHSAPYMYTPLISFSHHAFVTKIIISGESPVFWTISHHAFSHHASKPLDAQKPPKLRDVFGNVKYRAKGI